MTVSNQQFVQPRPRAALHLINVEQVAPVPAKMLEKVPGWIGVLSGITDDSVEPGRRNVLSRKTKRWRMKQDLFEAGNFLGRLDVVDHGKKDAPHRVAQWQRVRKLSAVDADRPFDVGRNVSDVLDGVRGAVLTVFHGDLVDVSELPDHQGSSSLKVDFPFQVVHDAVAKLQRTNQRRRWTTSFNVTYRPVVL